MKAATEMMLSMHAQATGPSHPLVGQPSTSIQEQKTLSTVGAPGNLSKIDWFNEAFQLNFTLLLAVVKSEKPSTSKVAASDIEGKNISFPFFWRY